MIESGIWEKVFLCLSKYADNEYVMIDSMIVRAHQHVAGARGWDKKRMHW